MNKPSSFSWRPKTTVILLGGFAIILVAVMAAFITANFKPTTPVRMGSGAYNLWVADTEYARQKGLSGVEKLKINGGLIMDFQQSGLWGIWMKDMKIPLDILWIDSDKRIVYIEEDVSPDLGTTVTMTPKVPVRYVIELPAGSVGKAGIKEGQIAEFTLPGSTK